MNEDRIGDVLAGRYRLGRAVGEGPGATVFLARDVREDRRVSVAVFGDAATEGALERIARLDHPSIARVIDSGVDGESTFVVTEHYEGGSLEDRFASGAEAVSPGEVLRWLGPVAEALDHLRTRGLAHPGLAPSDVLFDAGGRAYLSPTDALAGAGDASAAQATGDTEALAKCIYRAVIGSSPAPGASRDDLRSALDGRLPDEAADAVAGALAPEGEPSFLTATALYEAYQAGLAGAVEDFEPKSPLVRFAMVLVLLAMAAAVAVYVLT